MKKLHFIEITEAAAYAMLGKDNVEPSRMETNELAEWLEYIIHGVKMRVIHNYTSETTQFYIQDINA